MKIRKNQAMLSPAEKTAFVNAVLALKNATPSKIGLTNRYDDYVQVHMNAMMANPGWGHQVSAFLPWHRVLLHHFEADLQAIDPTVTIPYWDWTIDNLANPAVPGSPWKPEFMGGDGTGPNNEVMDGPFASSGGHWPLNVLDTGLNQLQRQLGRANGIATLPSQTQQAVTIGDANYDIAPWTSSSPSGFRNHLEGWIRTGTKAADQPPQMHNRVHVWVGGSMLPMSSPNDPIFWLNHCNIDRLWAVWQYQHPTSAPYLPLSGAPTGQNVNDNMIFFDASMGQVAPWADLSTPASVTDHTTLGYGYDTDPTRPVVNIHPLEDAAWMISLWKSIHGGDPGPDRENSQQSTELIAANAIASLSEALSSEARLAVQKAIEPLTGRHQFSAADAETVLTRLKEVGFGKAPSLRNRDRSNRQ